MLKAANMKLLMVILAALVALSAVLFKIERHTSQEAKAAQQQLHNQEQIRKDDEDFRKQVEALKKKSHAYAGNESKTWKSYTP
jgi:hypothetical protein